MGVLDSELADVFPRFEWGAIRTSSGTHFPALSAWVRWCHAAFARLHLPSEVHSEVDSGVEQGDPLNSLLASTVVLDMVEAAWADLAIVGIMFFDAWWFE